MKILRSFRFGIVWHRLSADCPGSRCLVCCQHIDLWFWMPALSCNPFYRWSVQVLCIVAARGSVRCSTIHTVKIAVHSAEDCCTATTMALTSSKQTLWSSTYVYGLPPESRLSIFRGSAGPQPLRISRSLAMAEFSVKSFALFMWWRVFEACSQICYLTGCIYWWYNMY